MQDSPSLRRSPLPRMAACGRGRLVASDGFDSTAVTLAFGLDNPIKVLAEVPADGSRGVSVRTKVEVHLRDPLDPTSLDDATLTLFDDRGATIPGSSAYEPLDSSVVFTPTLVLDEAATYWARLSGRHPERQRRR